MEGFDLEAAIQDEEEFGYMMKFLDDISVLVRAASSELSRELYTYMMAMLEARTHATLDHIAGRDMAEAGLVAQSRMLSYMEAAQMSIASDQLDFLTNIVMEANSHAVDPEKCKDCVKRETCPMYLNYLGDGGDIPAQEVN